MRVKVDVSGLKAAISDMKRDMGRVLLSGVLEATRETARFATHHLQAQGVREKTGKLFSPETGIEHRSRTEATGFVFWNAEHATWIDQGTRAHPIAPKDPDAGYPLRFFWERMGEDVEFSFVNHPGNRAYGFKEAAAHEGEKLLQESLEYELEHLVAAFNLG